jgi:hypothetical protein
LSLNGNNVLIIRLRPKSVATESDPGANVAFCTDPFPVLEHTMPRNLIYEFGKASDCSSGQDLDRAGAIVFMR